MDTLDPVPLPVAELRRIAMETIAAIELRDGSSRTRLRRLERALRSVLEAAESEPEAPRTSRPLTPRELQVLERIAASRTYEQIAAELVVELETVRTHARSVRRKLGVGASSELRGLSAERPQAAAPITP